MQLPQKFPEIKLPSIETILKGPESALAEIERTLNETKTSFEETLPVPKLPYVSIPRPGAREVLLKPEEFLKLPTEIALSFEEALKKTGIISEGGYKMVGEEKKETSQVKYKMVE